MTFVEDVLCFCYMSLISFGLLYQLGSQSTVTVECENAKTFCLKHLHHESNLRHTFTAKDLETKCNVQGLAIWFLSPVLLGLVMQLVVFGGAIYVYYYKPKTIGLHFDVVFQRCVYAVASVNLLLICLLVVIPLVGYTLPGGGPAQWGMWEDIWNFPPRGVALLIIKATTAPIRWVFHNRFKTELWPDRFYENYTCVEPIVQKGLSKCPMESQFFSEMSELLTCESDFYCTDECFVVFPRIIINSLSFIFASLALCYRLLKLTHYIKDRESGFDLAPNDGCSTISLKSRQESSDSQDKNLNRAFLDETSNSDMKNKSVMPLTKTAGFKAARGNFNEYRNATRNVRKRGDVKETTQVPTDSQRGRDSDKFNGTRRTTADTSEVNDLDSFSDKQSLASEKTATEYRKEQKPTTRKNILTKDSEVKFSSASNNNKTGFTKETVYNSNKAESLKNGGSCSQHKQRKTTKVENLQGEAWPITNGHAKKEHKVYRRGAKLENKPGVSEMKKGSLGNCNGTEGQEAEQWSSSEDIIEGIEGFIVEDESEFYMSGFRL